MARENFPVCLPIILKHEGGWADHPKDPGGATMKGITLTTFRRYKPNAGKTALRNISDEDVARIYRDGYWDTVGAEALHHGVDLAVFDVSVNSGPGRAKKLLAANATKQGDALIKAICASRMAFLRGLKHWSTFGKGWSRRVADIEARGVAMYLSSVATRGGVKLALVDNSEKAAVKSKTEAKAVAGTTVAGAGGASGLTLEGFETWQIVAMIAVTVLGVIWLAHRSAHNKDRAAAYDQVARELKVAR